MKDEQRGRRSGDVTGAARDHLRVVAIIQARMGSARLPGKALIDIRGEPMLFRVVGRLRRCRTLDDILVASTTDDSDDVIERACNDRGVRCFRGSVTDVLDRYYRAAQDAGADAIVRITSDCPLIDPGLVDAVTGQYLRDAGKVDYVSNVVEPRTYPRGLDTEVFSFEALQRAWTEDKNSSLREHVTQYILRHPDKFIIKGMFNPVDMSHMRWTVDTPEDLSFVRRAYALFENDDFTWTDLADRLKDHPEVLELNRKIEQKKVLPSER